jgi:hypothetical protein
MSKAKKVDTTVVAEERCKSEGCKHAQARFTFCDEHYEWFKFGLITKVGKKVSDFEKKYTHYTAHFSKDTAKKAA